MTILRQVVLLTPDLAGTVARLRELLHLGAGTKDEQGMAALGFEHEVLRVDNTYLEVVAPLTADSSAGRLAARTGGCGYMVVLQVDDLAALTERGAESGLRPVFEMIHRGNPVSQWHPADLGTLAEIDQIAGTGWHYPELDDSPGTAVARDIEGVAIAVADPPACAGRWAGLLGAAEPAGGRVLTLGERTVSFRRPLDGRSGLVEICFTATDPAADPVRERIAGVDILVGGPAETRSA